MQAAAAVRHPLLGNRRGRGRGLLGRPRPPRRGPPEPQQHDRRRGQHDGAPARTACGAPGHAGRAAGQRLQGARVARGEP
eukprot:7096763-Heterocapsa_arctica.AAC.1